MQSFPTEKYTFVYKRQDGTVNTYVTSGPIVDKPHFFTAYKYSGEHQQYGIRSFTKGSIIGKIQRVDWPPLGWQRQPKTLYKL